jgi:S-adenosylmethionine:diacylglycerol 3-amino-3-carboxypropyl transferase
VVIVLEDIRIKMALGLMHGKPLKEKYGRYSKLYAFTTENIGGYYLQTSFLKKKVLTVCGSGDHVLNAILLGSNEIDTFDINILTYYFLKLKIAAVKTLSYTEFLDYFLLENNLSAMNYKLFQKMKKELESEILTFWEAIYRGVEYDGRKLRDSSLFHNLYDTNEKKLMSNPYLKEENFTKLKGSINLSKVTFIESSLLNLKDKCKENYDLIFLSNISDYLNLMFSNNLLENYREKIVAPLTRKLNRNGKLYFIYQYDIGNERSIVDNIKEVKKIFLNVRELSFPSVVGENKQDRILYIGR